MWAGAGGPLRLTRQNEMRSFLPSRAVVPLHLAFIAAYLACVPTGPDTIGAYLPIAFLAAGLLEVTLLFPAARRGEDIDGARRRVRLDLFRDPVLAFGLLGFLFIVVQTLNGPRELVYDTTKRVWDFSTARVRDFPACVDRLRSTQGIFWLLLVIPAMLAARRGLGRRGRILLFKCLVAVASASAIVSIIIACMPDCDYGQYGFAHFATPISAGMYFLMSFCIADGLYAIEAGAEDQRPWQRRLLIVGCVACAAGALFSLSCLSQVLLVSVFLVLLIYGAFYLGGRLLLAERIRMFVGGLILLGIAAFLNYVAYPENPIRDCLERIATPEEWVTEGQEADRAIRRTVARRMAGDNIWSGVGTWGYADAGCFGKYMEDDDWDALADLELTPQVADTDPLQFLAEYGSIGGVLLATPFALPVLAALWRLVCEFRPRKKTQNVPGTSSIDESHPFTERLSPLALATLLAIAIPVAVSFRFSVFRDPRNLLTLAILASVLPTLLPKPGFTGR